MFNKYQKSSNSTKILMMYLLLNGYDLKNVEFIMEEEENQRFGGKEKKYYGITKDFIDVRNIDKEIESIVTPIICTPLSFDYYSDASNIFMYEPNIKDMEVWVNDMSIISPIMVISPNLIVSKYKAKALEDAEEKGFMYFYDYVLKEECRVGRWYITYKDRVFSVFYNSLNKGKCEDVLLYSSTETDKTSTFKYVIYIIKKASVMIDKWQSDNYVITPYELKGGGKK